MRTKKGNKIFCLVCIAVLIVQYALCIHYGLKREYLFCDEVYSYGLANSTDHTFLHPGENDEPLNDWVSGTYFSDYMNYGDKTFNYKAAYVNQENDVHPPLYYMLLHTVCSFFKDQGYSAVPGLILNLILLIFVDICLLYIASFLLDNRWYGLIATALWGISSVGISNCMLIRMYLLQTLNVLAFLAVHVYILRHKRKMTAPYFVMLALTVMFGGLTHYYFYFFVAGLGVCVCAYLLYMKQFKQMFAYGFSLVVGLGAAIAIFPATIDHIFGYRGSYATSNLAGFAGGKFIRYIKYVNKAYFAGLLPFLLLVAFVLLVLCIVKRIYDIQFIPERDGLTLRYSLSVKHRNVDRKITGVVPGRGLLLVAVCIADIVLAFVGIQGSQLVSARYIYSALPVMAVFTVWCMMKLFPVIAKRRSMAVTAALCAMLCAGSLVVNGVDWQYKTYSKVKPAVEEMKNGECLIICHGDGMWNNIYAGVNVFSNMDRCRYVYENDMASVAECVQDCGDEMYVAFVNDPKFKFKIMKKKLEHIIKTTKYKAYEVEYNYNGIRIYKLTVDENVVNNMGGKDDRRIDHENGKFNNSML